MKIHVTQKHKLADTYTPVSIYLKIRTLYPESILLESSDYHGSENAMSFICLKPIAQFLVENRMVYISEQEESKPPTSLNNYKQLKDELNLFLESFDLDGELSELNGLFGYASYDSVKYFENIEINNTPKEAYKISELRYRFYQYIIALNHSNDTITIIENLPQGQTSELQEIENHLNSFSSESLQFKSLGNENSNITDQEYRNMVSKAKEHCQRGDVFQIVLSRQYSQAYQGDDFMLYRALRSINPSPYLFYFDYGNYRLFGSSPEAQIRVKDNQAVINPIAGTFKRTGDDQQDAALAQKLSLDPKENAEHVMLVDLARNDLSRNASNVKVDTFCKVQYFSHVIHLVSEVSGKLNDNNNIISVLGDSFPAGTLSGAPKHRAMQLIDCYENQSRSYYGGTIGFIGFNKNLNHAIMIRSFLSKENTLFYQAGAGIVSKSDEENELQEVNNKLAALKKAIRIAEIY